MSSIFVIVGSILRVKLEESVFKVPAGNDFDAFERAPIKVCGLNPYVEIASGFITI